MYNSRGESSFYHFIIGMGDWTDEEIERKDGLEGEEDKFVDYDNKQTIVEEGSSRVRWEMRLGRFCSSIALKKFALVDCFIE
jgi:hypothetical protein